MRSRMSNAAARAGDTAGRDSRVLDFTASSMTDRISPQEKFDPYAPSLSPGNGR
jgi:hypothetical protein